MKRYILTPEDTIRCLPNVVEIFCERSVIYFEYSDISELRLLHRVRESANGDALCLTAADSLFQRKQLILLPLTHPDYPAFSEQLRQRVPALFQTMSEEDDLPPRCDQNGHHFD